MVDKVQFEERDGQLAYRPTQGARVYQSVAALGIALVAAFFAFVFAKNKPLAGLLEQGETWNSATVIAFGLFSVCLILAIPFYLRGAARQLVLVGSKRCLRIGRGKSIDLSSATSIALQYNSGRAGEYSGGPTWSVVASEAGKHRYLPLLTFEQQTDARRVADEVAALFGLKVV